jgi:hypothetical protein
LLLLLLLRLLLHLLLLHLLLLLRLLLLHLLLCLLLLLLHLLLLCLLLLLLCLLLLLLRLLLLLLGLLLGRLRLSRLLGLCLLLGVRLLLCLLLRLLLLLGLKHLLLLGVLLGEELGLRGVVLLQEGGIDRLIGCHGRLGRPCALLALGSRRRFGRLGLAALAPHGRLLLGAEQHRFAAGGRAGAGGVFGWAHHAEHLLLVVLLVLRQLLLGEWGGLLWGRRALFGRAGALVVGLGTGGALRTPLVVGGQD